MKSRRLPDAKTLREGLLAGDRLALARSITLVESTLPEHSRRARELLESLPPGRESRRIGISGPPGVGKSTFLNAWGERWIAAGHRLAVLAVDPSSELSGGSILGDKTRMEELSRHEEAFIRPSPSSGSLGGVGRRTRECMRLCEAAGFDTLIVETVGVGQNEAQVRSMVDSFLLLLLPESGDHLQGIKRGIMELADAFFVNKAEGENRARAERLRMDLEISLPFLPRGAGGWKAPVHCLSARTGEGLEKVDQVLADHARHLQALPGGVEALRRRQDLAWMRSLVEEELLRRFWNSKGRAESLQDMEKALMAGKIDPWQAHLRLLDSP